MQLDDMGVETNNNGHDYSQRGLVDPESQLPYTQAQPSLTLNQESQTPESQALHFTAINTYILLQAAQTEAPQPHSAMDHFAIEIEQQLPPPTQQTPSPAINPQQIMGFCFQAATQIAVQHSKLPIPFYLHCVSILLTFASLFVSHLINKKFPHISKVLEKVAIFLAAIAFFTAVATPFAPSFN